MVEQTLITEAVKNGIWALLFVVSLVWNVKENKARETKYQELIHTLSDDIVKKTCENQRIVIRITKTVDELDGKLINMGKKVERIDNKVDTIEQKVDGLHTKTDSLNKSMAHTIRTIKDEE